MTDTVDPATRSRIMSSIRSVSRLEELALPMLRDNYDMVSRPMTALKFKPDFVGRSLSGDLTVIFIHGCFWHGCGRHFKCPKTRRAFWANKIRANKLRDRRMKRYYQGLDVPVDMVWEHEVRLYIRGAGKLV